MKKKAVKKSSRQSESNKKTSELLTEEVLKKTMLVAAKQQKIDSFTFNMMIATCDPKIKSALKNNKNLTKIQKRQLGINDLPFIHTEAWRELPAAEAKKHLIEALKVAGKDFWEESDAQELLYNFTSGKIPKPLDLNFSTEESKQILEIILDYLDDDLIRYDRFVNMLLNKNGWKLQFDAKTIYKTILTRSAQFIRLIDTLPKNTQDEIIQCFAESPLKLEEYVCIINYCFPFIGIYDVDFARADNRYYADNCSLKTPSWTTAFLQKVKLADKYKPRFNRAADSVSYDSLYADGKWMCSDELIEAAINSGLVFIKYCDNFNGWLAKKMQSVAQASSDSRAVKNENFSERIAQWICSEKDNANKVCEVVELAGVSSV